MIRVKLLMWNDGEKSLSQLQTSKVRRPPWRPRYCLIWIRRQWSRVNKWSPKFIIMIQTKSSAMAPLVVLLLLCVFCSGGMTDPGAHPITTEQSSTQIPIIRHHMETLTRTNSMYALLGRQLRCRIFERLRRRCWSCGKA